MAVALASSANAQSRPHNSPVTSSASRGRIIVPGQPTQDGTPSTRPRIIQPGAPTPRGPIVRPGAGQPDPTRRIIRPGTRFPRPQRGPLVLTVDGTSARAIARALRSVGEHRAAAALCRRTGACSESSASPRAINAAARRGARPISLPVDTGRLIYSAGHRDDRGDDSDDDAPTKLARLTRVNGRNDPLAQRAYDKAGVILSFYRTVLGRQSFDDRNTPVRFVVHYGDESDNAAWMSPHENTQRIAIAAFGDGDDRSRSQIEGDTPYHELSHGVVDETANFEYRGESGALHEHFADVLGETAQQWELAQSVEEAAWLQGEGTYQINAPVGATRSFANPNHYGQPSHVSQVGRYDLSDDHDGVHTLGGIPNRAFYGAATRLGGHTWEHVGLIWYAALRDFLGRTSNFRDTANATVRAAAELFGERSREAGAVRAGWADVGIHVPAYRQGAP